MKTCKLGGGLEVYCLSVGEASLLYEDLFRDHGYFRHGIALNPGSVVFDVGANIGLFAIYIHRCFPGTKVYSFEPLPPVYEILEANVRLHGVDGHLFPCGLSRTTCSAEFAYYPQNSALSGQYSDPAEEERVARTILRNKYPSIEPFLQTLLNGKFERQRFVCQLRALSDIIAEQAVPRIDLLKIDVEKAEADVLAGIDASDWPRISQVVLEAHDIDGRIASIVSLLERHGFRAVVDQNANFHGTDIYDVYARR